MPVVRRGFRLLLQFALGLSVFLALHGVGAATVSAADLVLGFVPGQCDLLQTRSQAEALAAYLSKRLGQPIRVRTFKSEKNLHLWLNRFREVDFAVFSEAYLKSEGRGAFIPVAGYIRRSLACDGAGRFVARRGVPAFLFVGAGNALAELRDQALLDQLDILRFYRAGERPAGLPSAPAAAETTVTGGAVLAPAGQKLKAHKPAVSARPGPAGAKTGAAAAVPAQAGALPASASAGHKTNRGEKESEEAQGLEPVLELLSPRPGGRTGPTPMLQFHLRHARARILLDGKPVKAGPGDRLGPLADGRHELLFELTSGSETSVRHVLFEVDATPPSVKLERNPLPTLQPETTLKGQTEPGVLVRLLDSEGREVARTEANDQGVWQARLTGLVPGTHTYQLVARDVFGNESRTGLSVVRVEEMPRVTILAPRDGAVLSRIPTLAYTAVPGNAEVLIDGVQATDPPEALRDLADGEHSIEVRLQTGWGEVITEKVTFVLDRQGPDLVVASPVEGRAYNRPPVVEWGGELADVEIELDGRSVDVANGGRLPELKEGEHRLVLRARDAAGNETRHLVRFILDLQAPTVQLTAPADRVREASPTVVWQTDAANVRVYLDGQKVPVVSGQRLPRLADGPHTLKLEAVDAAGNVQTLEHSFVVDASPPVFHVDAIPQVVGPAGLTLSGSREPGSFIDVVVIPQADVGEVVYPDGTTWKVVLNSLQDGENLAVVTARDALGNEARKEIRFQVDAIPPKVHIVEPPAGTVAEARPALKVEADEGTVRVILDGEALQGVPQELGPLAEGDHTLVVEAVDAAGNRSRAERRFVVDTRPPEVAIETPAEGDRTGPNPVLDYRVVDGRGRLLLDGLPVEVEPGEPLVGLKDGEHRLRLEAVDAAGNLATAEVRFVVDSTAPKVILTEPASGVTFDPTPTLRFRADRGRVRVFVDDRPVDKGSGDSLDPLAPGEHRVRVEAVDEVGNIGRAERRFVVARSGRPSPSEDEGLQLRRFAARLDRRVIDAGTSRPLVLQLGPLDVPGETVYIEQWLDDNGNGVADTGEQVVQTFRLVDGIPPASDGVPGDTDGSANRRIHAEFSVDLLRKPGVPGKRFVLLIMTEHQLSEIGFRFADGG